MNSKMQLSLPCILSCYISLHTTETFVPDLWHLFNIKISFSILLDYSFLFHTGPGDSRLTLSSAFCRTAYHATFILNAHSPVFPMD